ncbi:multidrug transporter subunit MdtG, partial [Klebsiella oxytoca]
RAVFLVTAFVVLFNAVYSTLTLGRVRRQRATDNPGSGNHSVN